MPMIRSGDSGSFTDTLKDNLNSVIDLGFVATLVADSQTAQWFILSSCFIALFLGFFFMVIMKACAACITWTAIILIEVLCAALTYYMYDESLKK